MSDPVSPTVVILLYSMLGLVVLLLALLLGMLRCLLRIEWRLAEGLSRQEPADSTPSLAETSAGGAFESFLNEDPARRTLPKREQFAAYRRWRQEQGMNWSNS